MAETVPDKLRGLILHDPRFGLTNLSADTGGVGHTQAGPEPDQPTRTSGRGYCDLEATGIVSGSYEKRYVKTAQAGAFTPGPRAGRIQWSDDNSNWVGWLPHKLATGFSWAVYTTGTLTYRAPHAIQLKSGSVLLAYLEDHANPTRVECRRLDALTETWGSKVEIWDSTSYEPYTSSGSNLYPAPRLVQLPSGRVLCLWISASGIGNGFWINGSYSDDDGDTWVNFATQAAGTGVDGLTSPNHFSACYHGGYLTAVITADKRVGHYVSSDLGATWTAVDTTGDGDFGYCVEVVGTEEGAFLAVYIGQGTSPNQDLCFTRKQGAYTSLWSAEKDSILVVNDAARPAFDVSDLGHVGATIAQDGTVYVVARYADPSVSANPGCRVGLWRFPISVRPHASDSTTDNPDLLYETAPWAGNSWDAEILDWGDNTDRLDRFALCPFLGKMLLFHGVDAGAGAEEDSIGCIELGGYSSVELRLPTFGRYDDSTAYGLAFVPFILASSLAGWTTIGASAIESLVEGGMQLSAAGAATRMWGANPTGTTFQIYACVEVTSGGNIANDAVVIRARSADGVFDYDVALRLSTTAARLVDYNNASATLGTDVTGLPTEPRDWLIENAAGSIRVWYRTRGGTVWTLTHSVSSTNDGATPAANSLAAFGASGTVAFTSVWSFVGVTLSPSYGVQQVQTGSSLKGREISTRSQWLDAGIGYRGRGGPLFGGDTWEIDLRYQYPVEATDPTLHPSPRDAWRSTSTAENYLVWDLAVASRIDSPAIGLYLSRPLGRTAYLEATNSLASWTTLATIDLAKGFASLAFSRSGEWVYPSGSSASGDDYVAVDELAGGWAILVSGGTNYVRRIASNAEGRWIATGSGQLKRTELRLEIDGTEPTSGTIHIVRPEIAAVVWGVMTAYRYWRLRIASLSMDAGSPGYLSLAKAVIGPFFPLGTPYNHGRVAGQNLIQRLTESPDGRRQVSQLAPPRRYVEFQWDQPTTSRRLFSGSTDYITYTAGGYELASLRDLFAVEGWIRRLKGGEGLCVYLPSVAYASGASVICGLERLMYGRILSESTTRTTVVGDEAEDEASTRGALRIEEEV